MNPNVVLSAMLEFRDGVWLFSVPRQLWGIKKKVTSRGLSQLVAEVSLTPQFGPGSKRT